MAEIKIGYGVLLPHLSEQIHKQGFRVKSVAAVIRHEEYRQAEIKLRLAGMLTDSESNKVLERLHKRVIKNVVVDNA